MGSQQISISSNHTSQDMDGTSAGITNRTVLVDYEISTNSSIDIFAEDGSRTTACTDTSAVFTMIDVPTLAEKFPKLSIQTLEGNTVVTFEGIAGKAPSTSRFVELPVRCLTMDNKFLVFPPVRAHIVNKLPDRILLGLDFLIPNELDFRWGREGSDIHRLLVGDTGMSIRVRTKNDGLSSTEMRLRV